MAMQQERRAQGVPALRVDERRHLTAQPSGIVGGRFWSTSDEHDPDGHITEGVEMRMAMMHKRMGKLALAAKAIPQVHAVRACTARRMRISPSSRGLDEGTILDALRIVDAPRARR